jgi:hypothetical protein
MRSSWLPRVLRVSVVRVVGNWDLQLGGLTPIETSANDAERMELSHGDDAITSQVA